MAARNEEPIRRNGVRHSLLANASRRSAPALADSYAGEQGQTPVLNRGNAPPVAYQCTAGSKVWIQTDPCPAIYLKDVREGVGDSYIRQLARAGASVPLERVPVRQTQLDASELRRKLDDHKIVLKHDGSSDVYARNVAKSKYCP